MKLEDRLKIGKYSFESRLIVGSGKYKDFQTTKEATIASGSNLITVAVRRINITSKNEENLTDYFKGTNVSLLPNSAGCTKAEETITLFRMVRDAVGFDLIKLEVIGDSAKTLYPDIIETLKACEVLAKDGFTIMSYTNDDPITAKRLEDVGSAAVMPLASPIGSGLGIQNRYNILFIKEAVKIPVIVDAGIGCASDAAIAMEIGADAVLTNSALAYAKEPVLMAEAMRHAVIAGRKSFLSGRMEKKAFATASSPSEGIVEFKRG
ncbi:MAG: thiazole synthase [Campylobacteraceae bacterium]|jgi:thiazole synthase|nr:thiazole synthase [Campylobacteraceae bacterium]